MSNLSHLKMASSSRNISKVEEPVRDIQQFVYIANLTGFKSTVKDFQKLTPDLIQNSIIRVLLFFGLLDTIKYPRKKPKIDVKLFDVPDLLLSTHGHGDKNIWNYSLSLDNFYHDLIQIFPEDWDLDYGILILPELMPGKVHNALNYIAELCYLIIRASPELQKIQDEFTSEVNKFKQIKKYVSELEVEVNKKYKYNAQVLEHIKSIKHDTKQIKKKIQKLEKQRIVKNLTEVDIQKEQMEVKFMHERIKNLNKQKEILLEQHKKHKLYLENILKNKKKQLNKIQPSSDEFTTMDSLKEIQEVKNTFDRMKTNVNIFCNSKEMMKIIQIQKKNFSTTRREKRKI